MNYLESDLSLSPIAVWPVTGTMFDVTIGARSVVLSAVHMGGDVQVRDGVGLLGVYDEEIFSEQDLVEAACTSLGIPATIVPSEGDTGDEVINGLG